MKGLSLLLLRASTGIYMVVWGLFKFLNTEKSIGLSQKFYGGLLDASIVNHGLGVLQVLVGLFVLLGLKRSIAYAAQAAWYFVGLVSIGIYILDPLGLYFLSPAEAKIIFFPSTTLFFASLIIMAFREYDTASLDVKLGKK